MDSNSGILFYIFNLYKNTLWVLAMVLNSSKHMHDSGLSSLGVPGVPWHTQYLADQLTLFQPGGTDYTHLITTGTPGFSDLPTALSWMGHLVFRPRPFQHN